MIIYRWERCDVRGKTQTGRGIMSKGNRAENKRKEKEGGDVGESKTGREGERARERDKDRAGERESTKETDRC